MYALLTQLLDIPNYRVVSAEIGTDKITLDIESASQTAACPHCGKTSKTLHERHPRIVRNLPISGKPTYLRFIRRRFFCEDCHRAFSESLGFVDERRGYTHRYQAWIFHQVRENNIGAVHRAEGLTYDQIESIFLHEARCRIPLTPFANLKRLGIDEIALRKGRGDFALILTNLDTKEVVDVLKAHPQALQGAHYALLKNRQDLTDKQQAALEHVYQVSPLVKTAHRLKECLRHIFECKPTKEKAILGSGALLLRKRGCFHNSVGR